MGVDNPEISPESKLNVIGKFAGLVSSQVDKIIQFSELAQERGIDVSDKIGLSEYAEYRKLLQELDEKLMHMGVVVRSELKQNGVDDPDLELRNHLEQKNKGL